MKFFLNPLILKISGIEIELADIRRKLFNNPQLRIVQHDLLLAIIFKFYRSNRIMCCALRPPPDLLQGGGHQCTAPAYLQTQKTQQTLFTPLFAASHNSA